MLKPQLALAGITIGRDRFFGVLREKRLLLEPLPAAPRTTDSWHSLPVFHNLVKDLALDGPNQGWAADITYIRTNEGFLYLSLLMDLWSRKIVGYHTGDTLVAEGALRALGAHKPTRQRFADPPFGSRLSVLLAPVCRETA